MLNTRYWDYCSSLFEYLFYCRDMNASMAEMLISCSIVCVVCMHVRAYIRMYVHMYVCVFVRE